MERMWAALMRAWPAASASSASASASARAPGTGRARGVVPALLARLGLSWGGGGGGGAHGGGLALALDGVDRNVEAEEDGDAGARWDGFAWMAVPKKKTSHARKATRSAHKGVELARNITTCQICGGPRLAHHLCLSCLKAERNVIPRPGDAAASTAPPGTAAAAANGSG